MRGDSVVGIFPIKNGTEVVARRAGPEDFEAIFEVIRDRHADISRQINEHVDFTEEDKAIWLSEVQRPDAFLLLAELNNRIVGYTRLGWESHQDDGSIWVRGITVMVRYRRYGIGRAILLSALWEAEHTLKLDSLFLCVAEPNFAKKLYESCGFQQVGKPFAGMWLKKPVRRFIMRKPF